MDEFIKVFTAEGQNLNVWQMALRGLIIFILTILIVKLGKRKFLGRNSPFDIILAVIIGSVVSRAINGSATLFPTMVTTALLVLFHWFLSFISVRSKKFSDFIEGLPRILILNGKIDEQSLREGHFTRENILEAARLRANISDLKLIEEAYAESNGSISIIKKND